MTLFVNKVFLIIAFIPRVLILISIFKNNNSIFNNISFIKSLKKYYLYNKNKNNDFSPILNKCILNNNSFLYLYNISNNLEFRLYSNINSTNFSSIKIPNLNVSMYSEQIIPLKSGLFLNITINQIKNKTKYKINLSIYKYHPKKRKICSLQRTNQKFPQTTCFEPVENEIFCLNIIEQNPNLHQTQMNITHLSFNGKNIIIQSTKFLRSFNFGIEYIQSLVISQTFTSILLYKRNNTTELYILNNLFEEDINLNKCKSFKNQDKKPDIKGRRKAFSIYEGGHKVYIEGHRGDMTKFHENTILSFKEAIKNGIDSVELDVWLTNDSIPVVLHGSRKGILDKIKENNKVIENIYINNVTYEYIKQMNSKNKDKEIPTLEEVLEVCKNKIFINIELKDYQYELTFSIVTNLIAKKNMFDQIALSSFRHKYYSLIDEFNKNNTDKIECGHIFQPNIKIKDITNAKRCTANVGLSEINEELVKEAHKYGIPVMVYFLIGDEENEEIYKKLFDYNVDAICCNYPNNALKFRDKYFYEKYKNIE